MLKQKIEAVLPLVQKPGRYTGGELHAIVKEKETVDVRFAFCFPDTYEIGMSHLGMKILYSVLNNMETVWCERVFAPDNDMQEQMRDHAIPLFALESKDAVAEFDFIGFTLQYELCYTTMLNMLDLAGVPLRSKDRTALRNLVVVGGPCACNPEPIADFVDIVLPGEGEEVLPELMELYMTHKAKGSDKQTFLEAACGIKGVYVPAFYEVAYHEDGTIASMTATNGAPESVEKRIVSDLDAVFYPDKFVVPFIDIVHDRAVEEIFRGCTRGCRFCQAGFLYRPIREKSVETISRQSRDLCDSTGYDEVSLCSLSTSDYSEIDQLLPELIEWTQEEHVNLSLPSLRVDNFSDELVEQLQKVRRSGLTFAPEAGTQRLRNAINKNVSEEEVLRTCRMAFAGGWTKVKLYFMISLPTETMEDVAGIAELAHKVLDCFYTMPDRPKGKGVSISVSVASFIPKPFTPFQWEPQDTRELIAKKQKYLMEHVKSKKISVSWHETDVSFLEGVLAKGNRRLSDVIELAYKNGCKFDAWDDQFRYDVWMQAFEICGIDPAFYSLRKMEFDEILPWDHLDYAISKNFLIRENRRAHETKTTHSCREGCSACGADRLNGGVCHARS